MARIGLNALVMFTGSGVRNAGVSRYTRNLLAALLDCGGHEFTLFTNDTVRPSPFPVAIRTSVVRTRIPTARTPMRVLWEQTVLPLHSVLRGFDLVHSFLNVSPLLDPAAQVVTIHDLSYLVAPWAHPLRRRLYLGLMSRISAARAGAVLADSKATKLDLERYFGTPGEKVWVVYPGLDADMRPTSREETERFRARKGLPQRFVLYLGTLEPRKNLDKLVRAFGRLKRGGRYEGALVLAGAPGWGFEAVEAAIEREGLAGDVHMAGYVPREEQPLWYNAAQVFVYPSAYEGFGMPVLEAMACGTPVITSNTSSLPEVVGSAGITLQPDSVEAIAEALDELLSSSARREELTERGLAQASRFSWEIAAERCLEAYRYALLRS